MNHNIRKHKAKDNFFLNELSKKKIIIMVNKIGSKGEKIKWGKGKIQFLKSNSKKEDSLLMLKTRETQTKK